MAFIPEDHITDYLDGALEGEDLRAFTAALNSNASLRKSVALQQRIEAELAGMGEDEKIAALLKNADTAHPYVPPNRLRRFPPWLLAAALITLVVGAWFILRPQRLQPPQLAARYAEKNFPESVLRLPESVLPINARLRRDDKDTINLFHNARNLVDSAKIHLYARNYAEALRAYRQIPNAQLDDSLRFQKSLLLLQFNEPASALDGLEEIDLTFNGGLYWYKTLALLYLNEVEAARTQLQFLVEDENSSYHSEALQLKEEIDTY